MLRHTIRVRGGRLIGSAFLVLVVALLPLPNSGVPRSAVPSLGAATTHAQGGMDVGIVTPSFSELPRAVSPGDTFAIGVSTAPGARCSGQVSFQGHEPIDLEELPAPGGSCSWTVTVPTNVRPSTATIVVPLTRSGQWWTLYGIVYVRPVGESRW